MTELELANQRYTENYQPSYPDESALLEAVDMVSNTVPPASHDSIDNFLSQQAAVRRGDKQLVLLGHCAEQIRMENSFEAIERGIASIGDEYIALSGLAVSVFGESKAVAGVRGLGQYAKPRSNAVEQTDEGLVPSYYGDSINSIEPTIFSRTPDPSRMVAAIDQARDVREYMNRSSADYVPAAHELLLMPYEEALITDEGYSLSGEMLWLGDRTKTNEAFLKLLGSLHNARGAKVGPSTTTNDIALIAQHLSRPEIPGGLSFMFRLGAENMNKAPELIEAIDEHAPEATVLYDPHELTYKVDGRKTRAVEDALNEIMQLNEALALKGRKLNGVILESIGHTGVRQCVERRGQTPDHDSLVDPQFNLDQTREILKFVKRLTN